MRYSSHDGKDSERPVRLDKTEGTVIIEGRAYPAREIVEALAQSGYSEIRSVGDSLILGRSRITPIFKSRQDRVMASLCHQSLAYCCPLSKRCAERDRALEVLGLTNAEYENLKGDAHHKFIDASKGVPSSDMAWSGSHLDRTVNDPAIDRGYGSDDYRSDFENLDRALQSGRSKEREDSHLWSSDDKRYPARSHEGLYSDHSGSSPFTDVSLNGTIMKEVRAASRELKSAGSCSIQRDPSIEGIGALFAQGELSPFADDSGDEVSRPSFCFSCGRTFKIGTRVCPHCGAPQ